MRSCLFSVYLRKTLFVFLPLIVCLFSGQPALSLKLVASTALNMPEPNAYDFASGVYRASSGDLYVAGIVDNWNAPREVIARYTPELVLVSSANVVSSSAFAVDQNGNVYVAKGENGVGLVVTKLTPGLVFASSVTVNTGTDWYSSNEMVMGPDGDIYVSGLTGEYTAAKGYVVRLDQSLSIVSSVTINSGGPDRWCDVTVNASGAVYAVTDTGFYDGRGLALFKYDASFNLISSEELHLKAGGASSTELARLEIIISSGDVFVGGETADGINNISGFLAKFTSAPIFVSSATIIPTGGSIYGVTPANNGSVYLTGFKFLPSINIVTEIVVVKVSPSLVLESSASYKDFDFYYNRGRSIVSDQEGNVFLAGNFASRRGGEINSDLWLAKLDEALSCVSSVTINSEDPDSFTHLDSVALGPDGSAYVSGSGDYVNSGLVAKYSPHLVRISSATGFNSNQKVYMDMDDSGNIYFRTEEAWGNGNLKAVYKYDKDLQFVSSQPFSGSFNFAGKLRVIAGSIFLSGQESTYAGTSGTWQFDSNLVLLSTAPFPGPYGFNDIAADEFGNLYSVGLGFPPGGGSSVGVLVKDAPALVEISSVNFFSTTTPFTVGVSTYSHRILVGGIDADGGFVAKFDYELNLISSMTFHGLQDGLPNTRVERIVVAPDNNIIAVGAFQNKLLLARLSPDLVILSSMTIDLPDYFDDGVSAAVSRNGDVYVAGGSGPSSSNKLRSAWLGWFTYADEAGAQQGVAPAPFTALSTGSLTAVWASTYQTATLYYASISTSPDFSPSYMSSSTYSTQAAFNGLGVNTIYYSRVYDPVGAAFVDLGSASTLALPPAAIIFDNVWASSAAISWSANGNPAWTVYEVAQWGAGASTVTIAAVSGTSAVVNLAEGTSVYMSVRAVNGGGVTTEYAAAISKYSSPAQTAVLAGVDREVLYSGPSGEVKANIPAGSFPEAVNITIKTPAAWLVPLPTAGVRALRSPVSLEVTLDKALQPARNVEITVGYRDSDFGGMDESKLVLTRYDDAHGVWVPLPSTRDPANNRITAVTRHFSLFQVMQVTPSATLSGVTVGPNPLRPSRNPGQKYTFRNLPADGRVRIYTYLGELLWEGNADVSGMAVWDGRNKANSAVASGLYLALVEGSGGKKLLKLVIER